MQDLLLKLGTSLSVHPESYQASSSTPTLRMELSPLELLPGLAWMGYIPSLDLGFLTEWGAPALPCLMVFLFLSFLREEPLMLIPFILFSYLAVLVFRSDQIRSVTQSCPTLCDPMNRSTLGLPVHHQLLEFTQTNVHQVSDAIQPSHPLSSPSPLAPNPSQHQSLFQWVNSSHKMAKVLEFQL